MSAETPLVPRPVRTGGVLLAAAAAQFLAVLLWVQNQYPSFDPWTTTVTSLHGAPAPWAAVFDGSLVALGALATLGLLFAWGAFDPRPSRGLGLLVLLTGSVAAVVAGALFFVSGSVPASSVSIAVYLAVAAVGIGLVVVSTAMHQHGRWRISAAYTLVSGAVVLGAGVLSASRFTLGLGAGGLERIAVVAAVGWALVEGLHLAWLHRFAPGLSVHVSAA